MIQGLFLLSVVAGALTMVAAILIAGMHWRRDPTAWDTLSES